MRKVQFAASKDKTSKVNTNAIKKCFKLSKDQLLLDDIVELVNQMKIDSDKSNDIANKLFKELGGNKQGYVNTEELIEELLHKKHIITDESYSTFYNKIDEVIRSNSETIITKLRRLKGQKWIENDQMSLSDIQWIISSLTDHNLYEIDTSKINLQLDDLDQSNDIAFLVKYSKIEDKSQLEKDYTNVRRKSKIYSTTNIKSMSNISVPPTPSKTSGTVERRRSTNLNTMISPSIAAKVYNHLCRITFFDYNIFELDELLGKRATIYTANEILGRFDVVQQEVVEDDILKNFLNKIVDNYDRINALYHNDLHAGDVMQTTFAIISEGDLREKMKLGQLDIFAVLIAAFCHDYRHTGQNNLYHINSKSKLAMRYNENYHIAQSMKVLYKKDYNIFNNFPKEEFRTCKRRMIEAIFATDMANHQSIVGGAKLKGDSYNVTNGSHFEEIFDDETDIIKLFDAQQCILNLIVHLSDISNPGKPDKISEKWTKRVYDEFFNQGDLEKEKKLPISAFCDRESTNINQAMIGFITFVVAPSIDILQNLIPEVKALKSYCKSNLIKHQLRVKLEEKNKHNKASK